MPSPTQPTLRPGRTLGPGMVALALAAALSASCASCASLPQDVQRPVSTALSTPESTPLGGWVQTRRTEVGTRQESAFRLLDNVELALGTRLALIAGAQHTLDLQYYAIHADSSTELLLQRLRDAAARGVRVRLLLDDLNTAGRDAQVLRLATEPGVSIRLFNPLTGGRASVLGRILGSLGEIGRLQKRMHNKLFIADNTLGITGGRNLGDAYFGQDATSNFVDLDVLAAGAVVRDMSRSFDSYWNNPLAYPVESLVSRADLDALRQPLAGAAGDHPAAPQGSRPAQTSPTQPSPAQASTGNVMPDVTASLPANAPFDLRRMPLTWAPAALLVDQPGKVGPDDDEVDAADTVVDGLLGLMDQARHEVLVVSPYFVPGALMMKRLADLRARGVRIRVLTNSLASNDAPAAHAGYARYRPALLALGVELHEMHALQKGRVRALGSTGYAESRASLHSKAVIIDGRLAVIGSMNLDLRSQLQNSEVALVIRSATLAREATRQIEASLAHSAYRVEWTGSTLAWRAPPGADFPDTTSEPDASMGLKLLVNLIGPFAPDEML